MKKIIFCCFFFGFLVVFVEPVSALIYADADAYYSIGNVSVTLPNGAVVTSNDSGWDDPNCTWVPAAGLGVADLDLLPQWPSDLHVSGTVGDAKSRHGADMVWFSIKGGESGAITFTMPYALHAELVGWPSWADNKAYVSASADIAFSYYTWTQPYGPRSADVWLSEYAVVNSDSATSLVSGVLSLSIPYDATLGYTTYGYFSDSVSINIPEPVPEPSTMILLGIGFGGLAMWGKWRPKAVV